MFKIDILHLIFQIVFDTPMFHGLNNDFISLKSVGLTHLSLVGLVIAFYKETAHAFLYGIYYKYTYPV